MVLLIFHNRTDFFLIFFFFFGGGGFKYPVSQSTGFDPPVMPSFFWEDEKDSPNEFYKLFPL
jgi:hypothetical protein